jgi:hypothetical protein
VLSEFPLRLNRRELGADFGRNPKTEQEQAEGNRELAISLLSLLTPVPISIHEIFSLRQDFWRFAAQIVCAKRLGFG